MWEKIKNSRWPYIVISIIIAVSFWVYVRAVVDPTASKTFYNVEVQVVGTDVLESNGLMVSAYPNPEVEIVVKGNASNITKVTRKNISVSVDVSHITSAGNYSLSYDITLPNTVSASSVTARCVSPTTYDVTVSEVYSKSVSVEAKFSGSVAENYQAGEITVMPQLITITGEESQVSQIDHALVVIDAADLKQSISQDMSYQLIAADGSVVDSKLVTCNDDSVFVSMPVAMVKNVDLTVAFAAGGGATTSDITYTISPSTISVSGSESALEGLTGVSLGQIDLSKVITSQVFTFPINLDPALTNVSGITTATVTVTVQGLSRAVLSTDDIEIINVPEGYSAAAVTESLDVQIRGPQDAVSQVVSSQLRAVADLSTLGDAVGRYTVPVTVYLNGSSEVGIVGEYSIIVKVSK